jgi:hypothetical protein
MIGLMSSNKEECTSTGTETGNYTCSQQECLDILCLKVWQAFSAQWSFIIPH